MSYDVTVMEYVNPADVAIFVKYGRSVEPRKVTYRDVSEEVMNECMRGNYGHCPVKVLEVKPVDYELTADMVTGNGRWGCE